MPAILSASPALVIPAPCACATSITVSLDALWDEANSAALSAADRTNDPDTLLGISQLLETVQYIVVRTEGTAAKRALIETLTEACKRIGA